MGLGGISPWSLLLLAIIFILMGYWPYKGATSLRLFPFRLLKYALIIINTLIIAVLFSSIPKLIQAYGSRIEIFIPILITLIYIVFSYLYIKSLGVPSKLNELERFIFREKWKSHIQGISLFFSSASVPTSFLNRLSLFRKIPIIFLLYLAYLFFSLGFAILLSSGILDKAILIYVDEIVLTQKDIDESIKTSTIILSLIIIFFILSFIIKNGARYLARTKINKLKIYDTRPPIVYLRAFEQDNFFLPINNLLIKIFYLLIGRGKLDPIMLEECSTLGPVIALGSPREKRSPYGPSRYYARDDEWQQYVTSIINDAKIIYIFMQGTDGVEWEINQLIKLDKLKETIFIVAPKSKKDDTIIFFNKISDSLQLTHEDKTKITEKINKDSIIGFFLLESNLILLEAYRKNWTAYFLSIRASLRLKEKGYL